MEWNGNVRQCNVNGMEWDEMENNTAEGFRLQGDRLLVGRMMLVSGELSFLV